MLTNKKPWNLMNWVKKKKSTTEAIKFNKHPCNDLDNLWQAFHQFYDAIQDRLINLQLLNKVPLH